MEEIFCTLHLQKNLKCPKSEQFEFFSFFCSKSDHVLFFEMPHFRINIGSNASNDSKMGHLKNT